MWGLVGCCYPMHLSGRDQVQEAGKVDEAAHEVLAPEVEDLFKQANQASSMCYNACSMCTQHDKQLGRNRKGTLIIRVPSVCASSTQSELSNVTPHGEAVDAAAAATASSKQQQ